MKSIIEVRNDAMKGLRYLPGVSTLVLDEDACIGCSMCWMVCPHSVFGQRNGKKPFKENCKRSGKELINMFDKAETVYHEVVKSYKALENQFKSAL